MKEKINLSPLPLLKRKSKSNEKDRKITNRLAIIKPRK